MHHARSFPPLSNVTAHTLVLGSMPGTASLQAGQYYAHPRNLFWPFMQALFGIPADMDYQQRCAALTSHGIALWDVLDSCYREGSLDAAIDRDSMMPNNFAGFLQRHRNISRICFNGAKAEVVWTRMVLPSLSPSQLAIPRFRLPSTSPANASISRAEKLKQWSILADG
jgi:TDG/mug DNA glycosylase family protein